MGPLPSPRGPISEFVLDSLRREPHELDRIEISPVSDPLGDDDLHLALYLCYELHYRGLPGVDERWEWEPSLLALRGRLERVFEQALLEAVPLDDERVAPDEIDLALRAIADGDGPSLSTYVRSA